MSAHVDELLWAHVRGELSPEDAAQVKAHVTLCVDCARKLDDAKHAHALLTAVQVPKPSREFWERVDHKVLSAVPHSGIRHWWSWLVPHSGMQFAVRGLAFAALLALVAGLFYFRGGPDGAVLEWQGDAAKVAVAETQWIDTEAKSAQVRLPEGSRVQVAEHSRVRFSAASKRNVRVELERGVVQVAATHAEGRSFTVAAGDVEVVVVGTRFLVQRDDGGTVVEVFEGKVELRGKEQTLPVSAGQRAKVDEEGMALLPVEPLVQARKPEPEPTTRWPTTGAPVTSREKPAPKDRVTATREPHESVARLGGDEEPQSESETPPIPEKVEPAPQPQTAAAPTPDAGTPPAPSAQQLPSKKQVTKVQPWARDVFGGWQWKKFANVDWLSDMVPPGVSEKEYRARQLAFLADADRCEAVEDRAVRWMNLYARDGGEDPETKHLLQAVQFTRARCLDKMGRTKEADAIRAGH